MDSVFATTYLGTYLVLEKLKNMKIIFECSSNAVRVVGSMIYGQHRLSTYLRYYLPF